MPKEQINFIVNAGLLLLMVGGMSFFAFRRFMLTHGWWPIRISWSALLALRLPVRALLGPPPVRKQRVVRLSHRRPRYQLHKRRDTVRGTLASLEGWAWMQWVRGWLRFGPDVPEYLTLARLTSVGLLTDRQAIEHGLGLPHGTQPYRQGLRQLRAARRAIRRLPQQVAPTATRVSREISA